MCVCALTARNRRMETAAVPDSQNARDHATTHKRDRQAQLLLAGTLILLYGYFYQGGGWNQNSHFDTVRAMVETGSIEITQFAQNTADVGYFQGRVYSNKGPGLALFLAPFYTVLSLIPMPVSSEADAYLQVNKVAHALTFVASGLPGVVLIVVMYRNFRRQGATERESGWLAAAFGTGTLIFPYSGVMMSHVFSACLLFSAWHVLSGPTVRGVTAFAAGLLSAYAVVTDQLALPVAVILLGYVLWTRKQVATLAYCAGASLVAGLYLAYNRAWFGSVIVTNQLLQSDAFQTPGLLLGMLDLPRPLRLFLLTFHPYRGLFYCCPVLLIPLFSWRRPVQLRALQVAPLAVIAFFVLFNLSFNGWHGGWNVGPRYLIPMLPFLFSFALRGSRRYPRLSAGLAILSTFEMFSVAAVQLMLPDPSSTSARGSRNPIAHCVGLLFQGRLSVSSQSVLDYKPTYEPRGVWASYNLGELLGLPGLLSLVPAALIVLLLFAAMVSLSARNERGNSA